MKQLNPTHHEDRTEVVEFIRYFLSVSG